MIESHKKRRNGFDLKVYQPSLRVPNYKKRVRSAGDKLTALINELDSGDSPLMSFENLELFPVGNCPNADSLVQTATSQKLAVRRKRQRAHEVGVPLQGCDQFVRTRRVYVYCLVD